MIDDTEFTLLYDLHRSENPDIPHWSFEKFDLELLNEDVCKTEFRLYRNDIYALADVLDLPGEFHCYNNVNINSIEGLCILLKRFSYPCRYTDMVSLFARPVPQLSIAVNTFYKHDIHKMETFIRRFESTLACPHVTSRNLQLRSTRKAQHCQTVGDL